MPKTIYYDEWPLYGYKDRYVGYKDRYVKDYSKKWVNPNQKNYTKQESPYAFSEYYVHGNAESAEGCQAFYSDRAYSWWREKIESGRPLVVQEFGENGNGGLNWPLDAWDMLYNMCFDAPIKITAMTEGCNVGTGYPYFIFWYYDIEKREAFNKAWAELGFLESNPNYMDTWKALCSKSWIWDKTSSDPHSLNPKPSLHESLTAFITEHMKAVPVLKRKC